MPLPPTQYVSAGPALRGQSVSSAAEPGMAIAKIGNAIADLGEKGLRIVGEVRRAKESAMISDYVFGLETKASDFSNELLTRNDPENWAKDWRAQVDQARQDLDKMDLSPDGKMLMNEKFNRWATTRGIHFEAQAANRVVVEARGKRARNVGYFASIGDYESAHRENAQGVEQGISIDEVNAGHRKLWQDEIIQTAIINIDQDPKAWLENPNKQWSYETPLGIVEAPIDQREKLERYAKGKLQEKRSEEMDNLEKLAISGNLTQKDIDDAKNLTDLDKTKYGSSLLAEKPPTGIEHAGAWAILDQLEKAKKDPSVTDEEYRLMFNNARVDVVSKIAPKYQGDLKQQLSYLTPAGRDASGGSADHGYSKEDLQSIIRTSIFQARDMGEFGEWSDTNPSAKANAATTAEMLRAEGNARLRREANMTPEAAQTIASKLIGDYRTASAAGAASKFLSGMDNIQKSVPGTGSDLRSDVYHQNPDAERDRAAGIPVDGEGGVLPPKGAMEKAIKTDTLKLDKYNLLRQD